MSAQPTRAADVPPVTIGRYTVAPSVDPRVDAWYISTPSPLGADHTPFVIARASSHGLAVQVAASLHALHELRAVIQKLDALATTPAGRAAVARLMAALQAAQP